MTNGPSSLRSSGRRIPRRSAPRNEIVTTRVLGASREVVFEAWTDPDRLARWWGPKDFTKTFLEFDPRPGGAWRFVMHGPDGGNFPNKSVFVEVAKPQRIVFRHLSAPEFPVMVTVEEEAGAKTRLAWSMLFGSVEEREKVERFAVEANEQNLDRLEAHLAGIG